MPVVTLTLGSHNIPSTQSHQNGRIGRYVRACKGMYFNCFHLFPQLRVPDSDQLCYAMSSAKLLYHDLRVLHKKS